MVIMVFDPTSAAGLSAQSFWFKPGLRHVCPLWDSLCFQHKYKNSSKTHNYWLFDHISVAGREPVNYQRSWFHFASWCNIWHLWFNQSIFADGQINKWIDWLKCKVSALLLWTQTCETLWTRSVQALMTMILKQLHGSSPAGFTGFQFVTEWTQQAESAPDRRALTAATHSYFQWN